MEKKLSYVKKGLMKKKPFDMTAEELEVWQKESSERTRDYLFSIGQPLVYGNEEGQMVAEYADGRIEIIESRDE